MNKVLVFDLDDTLFLEKSFVLSGFRAVSDRLGEDRFYAACLELYNAGFRGDIFNKAVGRLGIEYEIAEMVTIYRSHAPKIELLEEAKEIITYFSNKNSLAIITDGYLDAQKNKIKSLGIEKFFDIIVYSDSNGREAWKPSQWPYKEVMKHYNKNEGDYVYVGDNVLKDFVTAKKLGWKTIQIIREGSEYSNIKAGAEYQADYRINSLLELKNLIGTI